MSKPPDPDDVVTAPARTRRGTAAAATALAALLLMGLGLTPAAATDSVPASPHRTAGSEAASAGRLDPAVAQRLAGVAEDLAEAITHGEITEAQATVFLEQVFRRIAS